VIGRVRQAQGAGEKHGCAYCRGTRQGICRAGRAEHAAGRATAECGAHVSAFAVLQQYQNNDCQRAQNLHDQQQSLYPLHDISPNPKSGADQGRRIFTKPS
jgi:hypothetical protein